MTTEAAAVSPLQTKESEIMNNVTSPRIDDGAAAAPTQPGSHASAVLYPAIKQAMDELDQLPPTFNFTVNRAFNILHRAFWSECPAPASASLLRPESAGMDLTREPVALHTKEK